ncbi:STAS domain-containing protein [Dyella marensis]|uniref:Phospholipid transport system transporter-binding protein n=1 Tax=Dyella marensis TaxID=500610 RepID=A0A1I2GYT8_9GAMM|nr:MULTISPECIES: STAS domain-containing protein [Dyella]SFF22925.1 phospholipid transport system transporter-binding protein [Dyella marensis]
MSAAAFQVTRAAPDALQVSGALTFATAAQALAAIDAAAADGCRQVDLAGVSQSDSAGLACVLAVLAKAAERGHALALRNVPEGMQVLAQVCEVDRLLA